MALGVRGDPHLRHDASDDGDVLRRRVGGDRGGRTARVAPRARRRRRVSRARGRVDRVDWPARRAAAPDGRHLGARPRRQGLRLSERLAVVRVGAQPALSGRDRLDPSPARAGGRRSAGRARTCRWRWSCSSPIFLVSVPLSAARLALAVQLQVSRVFWLTDAVAAAYVAWALVDSSERTRAEAWRWSTVGTVLLASVLRGYDIVHIETRRAAVRDDAAAHAVDRRDVLAQRAAGSTGTCSPIRAMPGNTESSVRVARRARHAARSRQGHGDRDLRSGRRAARVAIGRHALARFRSTSRTADVRALARAVRRRRRLVEPSTTRRLAGAATAMRSSWCTTSDDDSLRVSCRRPHRRSCRAAGWRTATR